MTPSLGIDPGPHWWEASALTFLRHPCTPSSYGHELVTMDTDMDKSTRDRLVCRRIPNNAALQHVFPLVAEAAPFCFSGSIDFLYLS